MDGHRHAGPLHLPGLVVLDCPPVPLYNDVPPYNGPGKNSETGKTPEMGKNLEMRKTPGMGKTPEMEGILNKIRADSYRNCSSVLENVGFHK